VLTIGALATVIALVVYVQPFRPTYIPEFAGIVESIGAGPGNTAVFRLSNGQEITVPANNTSVSIHADLPHVDDLMLAGGGGQYGIWVARLYLSTRTDVTPGCYELSSFATDEGDWIRMDFGLKVRKAPGFEIESGLTPLSPGQRYEGLLRFCLNEEGLVTAYT
jgi:hypothetical protein